METVPTIAMTGDSRFEIGRLAYRGRNPVELLSDLLSTRLPPLRALRADVPMTLDRIVAHATEHDRRMRYPSAATFQHDLLEARTAMRRAIRSTYRSQEKIVVKEEASSEWDEPTRRIPASAIVRAA